MHSVWAVLRITRLDSSILGFLCLFAPIYARTNDLAKSFASAIPLLFIWMCTFIANDLDDFERDRVNHPDRPLQRRHINPAVAAVLYFICLGMALFSTRSFVDQRVAFWYYALMTISISYGYVVEFLPSMKSLYVATAISIPIAIVAASYPNEKSLYFVALAGFLFALGRELCMDIQDRKGDVKSFIHRLPAAALAIAALGVQSTGLILLLFQVRGLLDMLVAMLMSLLLAITGFAWFNLKKRKVAIVLMKLQLFVGLYFLM